MEREVYSMWNDDWWKQKNIRKLYRYDITYIRKTRIDIWIIVQNKLLRIERVLYWSVEREFVHLCIYTMEQECIM